MKSLNQLDSSLVKFVFTDIDDTLTHEGRLQKEAYSALWELSAAGFQIVPITGRPAGWCELIARQWPVCGVIGENGAFYFRLKDGAMKRVFWQDENVRTTSRQKLQEIHLALLKKIPRLQLASDQFSRMFDLAIDICEDIRPPLNSSEIAFALDEFHSRGATAKLSSIHINGWFGDYDKLSMCKKFLKNEFQKDAETSQAECLFIGDSPNDEPMFSFFEKSVGVANVKNFKLQSPPKFVCSQHGGLGFAEMAASLLA